MVESIILCTIYSLFIKLKGAYEQSAIRNILKKLADRMKCLFNESAIWNFIKKNDSLSKYWKDSGLIKGFDRLINMPSLQCRRFVDQHEQVFKESITERILQVLLKRFEVLLGIFLCLVLIIPHAFWNNMYSMVGAVLFFILFYIKTIFYKDDSLTIKAIDPILFIFMISVILATVTSIRFLDSMRFLLFYIAGFLLIYILTSAIKTYKELERLIIPFVIGVFITALYGVFQFIVGVPVDVTFTDINLNQGMPGRVFSTMGNPNNYAEVLILTIPLFWALFLNAKKIIMKMLFGLSSLIPLIVLFTTGSRSGWLAFAGTLFIFVFLKNRKLIPLLILIGLLSIPLLPDFIYRRILTIWNPADTSAKYRFLIFQSTLPMLRDYWVTGIGLGSLPFISLSHDYAMLTKAAVAHSHNLFMQIWIETGVIGIVAFLWAVLRMAKKSLQQIFGKWNKETNHILMAGLASLSGALAMGLFEHIWFYPRVMLVFWIVIGFMLTALKIAAHNYEKAAA